MSLNWSIRNCVKSDAPIPSQMLDRVADELADGSDAFVVAEAVCTPEVVDWLTRSGYAEADWVPQTARILVDRLERRGVDGAVITPLYEVFA